MWIYINGEKVGNKSLNFRRNKDQKGIHACFNKGDLRSWGVINSISEETVCEIGLTSVIDNSYELFNEKKWSYIFTFLILCLSVENGGVYL